MPETRECPNCGAEIPAIALKCDYCKFEIKSDQTKTINYIQELQNKLIEADNSVSAKDKMLYGEMQVWKNKANIIQAFTLPTTKEDLMSLLVFAYSNYEGSKGGVHLYGNPIKEAWLGKAKQAYSMLKIYGNNDEQVQSIVAQYSSLDANAKSETKKKGWFRS